jgi:hypothetical protein
MSINEVFFSTDDWKLRHEIKSTRSNLEIAAVARQGQSAPAGQEGSAGDHPSDPNPHAISQERNLIGQWSHYELAYGGYIATASIDGLLAVVLTLRSCAYVLDEPGKEIWSRQKLEQLEGEVRQGAISPTLREEIASLARAIYDSGFRCTRDTGLK